MHTILLVLLKVHLRPSRLNTHAAYRRREDGKGIGKEEGIQRGEREGKEGMNRNEERMRGGIMEGEREDGVREREL